MPMSTITVAGINPGLNVLGATQQLNYTQPLSAFQITNSFVPTIAIPSQFNQEFRNNLFSGFRWTHETTTTDTHGSLTLQSFVNAQASGIDIITFLGNGSLSISTEINLNNNKIINLATPTLAMDAVTKAYADSLTSGIVTLVSDVTGSGNVGTNITTTFKPNPVFLGTDSMIIPLGTTAQRAISPAIGMIRYNTTINNLEIYNSSIWRPMGTGDGTVTSVTAGTGLNGGVITATGTIDIANTAVTSGSYTLTNLTVNAQGQITAASNGSGGGVQANLYMVNNVATNIIVTPAAFQKINGTTVSRFLTNFTMPLDNRLLYTGVAAITTLVSVNVSLSGTGSNRIYEILVYKNGVTGIDASSRELLAASEIGNITTIVPVALVTNDYIEIFVTASNTSTITVRNLNVSITI